MYRCCVYTHCFVCCLSGVHMICVGGSDASWLKVQKLGEVSLGHPRN